MSHCSVSDLFVELNLAVSAKLPNIFHTKFFSRVYSCIGG